jgi:type I site-specific restriction endonuclease
MSRFAEHKVQHHFLGAVSVSFMIATGADIKPLKCLLFMRMVKSRILFEQMLGRGTRVISPTNLQAVTADAARKERFVIVDAVGVVEQAKVAPFDNPNLRGTLIAIQQRNEQTLDQVSVDRVLETGFSSDATAKARSFGAAWPSLLDELNTALVA